MASTSISTATAESRTPQFPVSTEQTDETSTHSEKSISAHYDTQTDTPPRIVADEPFFHGIGGINSHTGEFDWKNVPWVEQYDSLTKQMIEQEPQLTDVLLKNGLHSVLDLWSQAVDSSSGTQVVSSSWGSISYREFENITTTLALNLRQMMAEGKLAQGDKVILAFPSSAELLVTMIGVMKAGLIPVPLLFTSNPSALSAALENASDLTHPKMVMGMGMPACVNSMVQFKAINTDIQLVVSELASAQQVKTPALTLKSALGRLLGKLSKIPEGAHSLYHLCHHRPNQAHALPPSAKEQLTQTALILLTSGTTGKSKAVELTHQQLLSLSMQFKNDIQGNYPLELPDNPVIYFPLPLGHAFGAGISLVFTPALNGTITLVLNPRDPKELVEPFNRHRPDILFGVAKVYDVVCGTIPQQLDSYYRETPPLMAISGAAAMTQTTRNRVETTMNLKVREGFGMSETSVAAALQAPNKHSAGYIPLAGNTYCILDSRYSERFVDGFNPFDYIVDPKNEGELCLSGNVSTHYLNQQDKTKETFVLDKFNRTWVRTGDLAKQTGSAGQFSIVGRSKEIINVNGANYNPDEIENFAKTYPDIEEIMVFRVPRDLDNRAGNDHTVLLVKSKTPLNPDDLKTHMTANGAEDAILPKEGCIIQVPINQVLPRTDTLKPKRNLMTQSVLAKLEGLNISGQFDTGLLHGIVTEVLSEN